MFTFTRFFARAQARLSKLGGWLSRRPQTEGHQEPLLQLPMLLSALLSPSNNIMATMKVAVTSMNADMLVCKSQKLMEEGAQLNLEINVPEVGPLHLSVLVEWVNLSSFGHSLGLKVVHKKDSRQHLQRFCEQLRRRVTA